MILLAPILIAILRLITEVLKLLSYLDDFQAVMYNALKTRSGPAISTWAVQCKFAHPVMMYMRPNTKKIIAPMRDLLYATTTINNITAVRIKCRSKS